MKGIKILDCTLRDGGYINDWKFGYNVIKDIIKQLIQTRIEIIEVGFLIDREYDRESSVFSSLLDIKEIISPKSKEIEYVAMIKLGEFPADKILPNDGDSVDSLRVIFKKNQVNEAYEYCEKVKDKGYKIYAQLVATNEYSDQEFIEVIKKFNDLNPHAIYIVDSFGVIENQDFKRYVKIADENMNENIVLGYHSHNNLQQAYGNSQFIVDLNLDRDIIIDASVFGMGRGAGNLNLELFAGYLNKKINKNYNIQPMLEIMDDHLNKIYLEKAWGYSLPYYLSALYGCHPNFAIYLSDKQTLTVNSINEILKSIPTEMRSQYSKEYAKELYDQFQNNIIDDSRVRMIISKEFSSREILLLGPGKTLLSHELEINNFIENNKPIVLSLNFIPENYICDYVICTNPKRYLKIQRNGSTKFILTSNINGEQDDYILNYSDFLVPSESLSDNVTLMSLNILYEIGIKKAYLAGHDGYSAIPEENYYNDEMIMGSSPISKINKNKLLKNELNKLGEKIDIIFITPTRYTNEEDMN